MNKLRSLLFICLTVSLSSCLTDDNETLVLPKVMYAKPIEEVVPLAIQQQLKVYMPIYAGTTPPDIEGTYLINPDALVYTSDGQYYVGKVFTDETIMFSGQNSVTNMIAYKTKQGAVSESSDDVSVSGSDDNFTAYFNTVGEYDDKVTTFKTATIISGTISPSGIRNLTSAFVMLEKNDPNKILMAVNDYRIFKDGNGLASNTTWTSVKSALINSQGVFNMKTSNSK
ncbi:MAG: hypothetical protein JZU47_12085 [Prolixibacteraceae bacterium]|nr:hypothetical protein [Prolixibacteraceae bacterium]